MADEAGAEPRSALGEAVVRVDGSDDGGRIVMPEITDGVARVLERAREVVTGVRLV